MTQSTAVSAREASRASEDHLEDGRFPALSRRAFTRTLGGAALLLAGCTHRGPAPLRLGINTWPSYEFLFLAQEKGFFREAGVNVRVVEFSSLSDCRRAYERGQIDAMGTTVVEVLQAREHSERSPQIVQVLDYSDGADVLIARAGIETARDLRGARIGVELASLGAYVLARSLELNGLSLNDVQPVSMDQQSIQEAFLHGELDAAVTYPPTSLQLQKAGGKVVFSTRDIPGEVVDVIAVEEHLCASRPEDVAKLIAGYQQALAWAAERPAEAHRLMAARERITPEEFAAVLADGVRMLSPQDQPAYLRPGGRLEVVISHCDRVLRATEQISGPDRREGSVNARLLTQH